MRKVRLMRSERENKPASKAMAANEPGADGAPSHAQQLSRVQRVIGVMSGKGGVGKSVVTALLALAMRRAGYAVGVLDADVTGPSIPKMLGLDSRPQAGEFGLFPVMTTDGIPVMSLNLLLDNPDDPVIWRGPLLGNTVKQFWEDVVWGDLDALMVDLPPGTSDVPLTVMQSLPVSGLIVVCSPQELAAMIVRKAIRMASALNVRVLGLVENMTYLICPHCGKRIDLFGPEQGPNAARAAGIPVLASIPVDPELSALCDRGQLASYQRNPFVDRPQILQSILAPAATPR
jgi:Mrp family chromosome partitioning ATPase